MTRPGDLRGLGRARRPLGSHYFWLLIAGTIAWFALGVTLLMAADWPADCDPNGDSRTSRILALYACSPRLASGGAAELATMLWLWSPAALLAGLFLWRPRRADRLEGGRMIEREEGE